MKLRKRFQIWEIISANCTCWLNFAEEVGKGFKVYESITFDQFKPMCAFDSDAGSSVFAVVRATCKALLTGHGSDKSGAGGYFQSFMRGKELTMQLADTAHSRMNVVFVNAEVFFTIMNI